MKPEKFIGIMLITMLLSCEMEKSPNNGEEKTSQKTGKVCFSTNQDIVNSSFEIDIYIDGNKILPEEKSKKKDALLTRNLEVGIHNYKVKVYTYNGESGKTIKGKFIVEKDKTVEVFINFKNFNSWT